MWNACFLSLFDSMAEWVINSRYFLRPAPCQDDSEALQYFSQTPTHLRVVLLWKTMRPFTAQGLSSAQKVSIPSWNRQICVKLNSSAGKHRGRAMTWKISTGEKEQRQDNQKTEICSPKFPCKPQLLWVWGRSVPCIGSTLADWLWATRVHLTGTEGRCWVSTSSCHIMFKVDDCH